MKSFENLTSIKDAASRLKISEELVMKFIKNGIVKAIVKCSNTKLTQYNLRRLSQVIKLHEQCLPSEMIEFKLNN